MFIIIFIISILNAKQCYTQDDEEGIYRGKFIGKINSYHHQVSGEVYAVDEWSLLLLNLNYDGMGHDTFFWAGDAPRPGPQGFIVPDHNGRANILNRYYNDEIQITLPEGKRISSIKWLAIYDISSQNAFGDVYIPEDFEAPTPRSLPPLVGDSIISSGPLKFEDAKTLLISEFHYDGTGGEVYFWTGVGPQPSFKGTKIPDEYGYLEPLRVYRGEDVRLQLPGELSVYDVNWISIYDMQSKRSLASTLVPEGLNVPPALVQIQPITSTLSRCVQLHKQLQVLWEVFGNQVTIQLQGQINEQEYMAFGISGSASHSQMMGADVAVTHYDPITQRGHATDYNVTALTPCVRVLGQWRGVCRDDLLGGVDDNQLLTAARKDGITTITYRRSLKPVETMDREWYTDQPTFIIWAVGMLDQDGQPTFHTIYPRTDHSINFGDKDVLKTCQPFTSDSRKVLPPWERVELSEPSLRAFTATVGPAGGRRGAGAEGPRPALVWYINGHMTPALQMRRGLIYDFKVFGGNDPHSPAEYHPLMISTEPLGGLESLSEAAQKNLRVLAGVTYTRRGRPHPTAAGPLCIARHPSKSDRRRDDDYPTFRTFNRTLEWSCAEGPPAILQVAPNSSWPDIVYYHSFTHKGMGGRIDIVDRHRRGLSRRNKACSHYLSLTNKLIALLVAHFVSNLY